jgi:hypothetical protein
MLINKLILPILIALGSLLQNGCSKDEWQPGLKGNMVGYVVLFDEFGIQLIDLSNVKITAIGSDGNYTANSDTKGRFELSNMPTGTYELHFEKQGFGTLKQYGVQHLGGEPTILGNGSTFYFLYKKSTATIQNMEILADTLFAQISWIGNAPPSVSMRLFFSRIPDFDEAAAEFIESIYLGSVGTNYKGYIFQPVNPFPSGVTVYYKAYIYTNAGNISINNHYFSGISYYTDLKSLIDIYPNASNESSQYEFVVP